MKSQQENLAAFEVRFCRCRRLLHYLACRVLGGPDEADRAVQKCWLTASRNPPQFDYEGAFRSWLVRVLIDEALLILREDRNQYGQTVRDCGSRATLTIPAAQPHKVRALVHPAESDY